MDLWPIAVKSPGLSLCCLWYSAGRGRADKKSKQSNACHLYGVNNGLFITRDCIARGVNRKENATLGTRACEVYGNWITESRSTDDFRSDNQTHLINHYGQKIPWGFDLEWPEWAYCLVTCFLICGWSARATAFSYVLYVSPTLSYIYYVWEGKLGAREDYKSLPFWWD